MAIMNKLTAAYVAGYLDGEGCFSIWYKKRESIRKKGRIFECVIRVGCTDKPIIDWLQSSFGGSTSTMSKPGVGFHRSQAWQWALRSKPVMRDFIKHVLPYLRVKKREAQIMLEYLDTFKEENYISAGGKGNRMKDWVFEKRTKLWQELSSLNKKGVRNDTTLAA
jgi:hypothetical protein